MPAAYLMVLAGGDKKHAAFVVAADKTRHVVGGGRYSLRVRQSEPIDAAERILLVAQVPP